MAELNDDWRMGSTSLSTDRDCLRQEIINQLIMMALMSETKAFGHYRFSKISKMIEGYLGSDNRFSMFSTFSVNKICIIFNSKTFLSENISEITSIIMDIINDHDEKNV